MNQKKTKCQVEMEVYDATDKKWLPFEARTIDHFSYNDDGTKPDKRSFDELKSLDKVYGRVQRGVVGYKPWYAYKTIDTKDLRKRN